ncbi:BBP7 family outer membrane beta-barrel protein [Rubripirellula tenax]|uniref:BBP7 family outer membrane beta-barrel protein n=1 Tax=Rubripirellula tenax TaxID=2528015 RepID=UPI0016473A61|nr:BBP7 family outer membrane beta-barrel protein [Rubripirellula tenax]
MLTLKNSICFSVALLVSLTAGTVAEGQTSQRSNSTTKTQSVRTNERVARANWQPTRNTQPATTKSRPLVDAPLEPAAPERSVKSAVRRVKQVGHGIPVPPSDTMSIMDSHEILDGQVMLSPMEGEIIYEGDVSYGNEVSYGGDSSCDAMGGCGCGDVLCGGGCDSMGSCGGGTCGGAGCSTCGELISPAAWRPCVTLCLPQDGWFSAEYLAWFQDGMSLPALVSTSPNGTSETQAGVLGGPATVLFGGDKVLDNSIDGFRLNFGVWLDKCHTWGLGGEYFRIGEASESFSRTSSGSTILARPFFNINPTTGAAREDAELVAYPNVVAGNVTARATSELFGTGMHLRYLRCCNEGCTSGLFCGCPGHFCSRQEAMFGYRYLQLDESVGITENLQGSNPVGSFNIMDRFETQNQFNGVDLGWKYRRTRGYWTADAMLRMAVGVTNQTVRINGSTSIDGGAAQSGGLLAQRGNIGNYEQDEFSVIPELDLKLGYQLTERFRATVGYTFLYWSNVVRPGDQISRDLNPALLPPEQQPFTGAVRPNFKFDTTDYWAQGISIGGEYRW